MVCELPRVDARGLDSESFRLGFRASTGSRGVGQAVLLANLFDRQQREQQAAMAAGRVVAAQILALFLSPLLRSPSTHFLV